MSTLAGTQRLTLSVTNTPLGCRKAAARPLRARRQAVGNQPFSRFGQQNWPNNVRIPMEASVGLGALREQFHVTGAR